jgi:hypothetical protein
MTRQGDRQGEFMVGWGELPRSPGHAFYDRLQQVLVEAGFDDFVATTCRPYYAARTGAPSAASRMTSAAAKPKFLLKNISKRSIVSMLWLMFLQKCVHVRALPGDSGCALVGHVH